MMGMGMMILGSQRHKRIRMSGRMTSFIVTVSLVFHFIYSSRTSFTKNHIQKKKKKKKKKTKR